MTARAWAFVVALVLRLAVVIWGRDFPPAADGTYYDKIARRIAEGHGYTWLWPDGTVTYAAHYPVGYPALVAIGYRIFGEHPIVAMLENALLGALAAWAVVVLAEGVAPTPARSRAALLAGIVFAVHPALLPYTIALMTEGVAIALVTIAGALAQLSRDEMRPKKQVIALRLGAALIVGAAVLVRPQWLLLAPVLGALSVSGPSASRARWAALTTMIALAVCAPWTVRNCVRMDRCALVSVNGGWNLLIGTQTESGSYATIDVPDECKTVWSEAGKDACFEGAARRAITADPLAFLGKIPKKLGTTFDYFGAAPWYLEASDHDRFPYRAKVALGAIETVFSRLLLVLAWVTWGLRRRAAERPLVALRVVAAVGILFALSRWGFVSYLLLPIALAWEPRSLLRGPILPALAAAVLLETCIMHSIFFGGGRYGLVAVPFVCALAFARPGATKSASTPPERSPVRPARAAREESPGSTEYDAG